MSTPNGNLYRLLGSKHDHRCRPHCALSLKHKENSFYYFQLLLIMTIWRVTIIMKKEVNMLVSGSATIPPTLLFGLLRNGLPLPMVLFCCLLINLVHCLCVRKPDVPVARWRWCALPLCAMPRHRLPVCSHSRSERVGICPCPYSCALFCAPIAVRCLRCN